MSGVPGPCGGVPMRCGNATICGGVAMRGGVAVRGGVGILDGGACGGEACGVATWGLITIAPGVVKSIDPMPLSNSGVGVPVARSVRATSKSLWLRARARISSQ